MRRAPSAAARRTSASIGSAAVISRPGEPVAPHRSACGSSAGSRAVSFAPFSPAGSRTTWTRMRLALRWRRPSVRQVGVHQQPGTIEADVDEGGTEAGRQLRHPPEEEVAGPDLVRAAKGQAHQGAMIERRTPGSPPAARRSGPRQSPSAAPSDRPAAALLPIPRLRAGRTSRTAADPRHWSRSRRSVGRRRPPGLEWHSRPPCPATRRTGCRDRCRGRTAA